MANVTDIFVAEMRATVDVAGAIGELENLAKKASEIAEQTQKITSIQITIPKIDTASISAAKGQFTNLVTHAKEAMGKIAAIPIVLDLTEFESGIATITLALDGVETKVGTVAGKIGGLSATFDASRVSGMSMALEAWVDKLNLLQEEVQELIEKWGRMGTELVTETGETTGKIGGLFKSLSDNLWGHSIIPQMINGIIQEFAKLPHQVSPQIKALQKEFVALQKTADLGFKLGAADPAMGEALNVFNNAQMEIKRIYEDVAATGGQATDKQLADIEQLSRAANEAANAFKGGIEFINQEKLHRTAEAMKMLSREIEEVDSWIKLAQASDQDGLMMFVDAETGARSLVATQQQIDDEVKSTLVTTEQLTDQYGQLSDELLRMQDRLQKTQLTPEVGLEELQAGLQKVATEAPAAFDSMNAEILAGTDRRTQEQLGKEMAALAGMAQQVKGFKGEYVAVMNEAGLQGSRGLRERFKDVSRGLRLMTGDGSNAFLGLRQAIYGTTDTAGGLGNVLSRLGGRTNDITRATGAFANEAMRLAHASQTETSALSTLIGRMKDLGKTAGIPKERLNDMGLALKASRTEWGKFYTDIKNGAEPAGRQLFQVQLKTENMLKEFQMVKAQLSEAHGGVIPDSVAAEFNELETLLNQQSHQYELAMANARKYEGMKEKEAASTAKANAAGEKRVGIFKKINSIVKKGTSVFKKSNTEIKKTTTEFNKQGKSTRTLNINFSALLNIFRKTSKETDRVGDSARDASQDFNKMEREVKQTNTVMQTMVGTAGGVFGALAMITGLRYAFYGLQFAIRGVAEEFIEVNTIVQDTEVTIQNMLKGSEIALAGKTEAAYKAFLDFITEQAALTPFDLPGAMEAGVRLVVAGLDPVDWFAAVADAAATLDKPMEQFVFALQKFEAGQVGDALMQMRDFGITVDYAYAYMDNLTGAVYSLEEAQKEYAGQIKDNATWQDIENAGLVTRNELEFKNGQLKTERKKAEHIILGYLKQEPKYAGAAAARTKTLSGVISNLGDNVSKLFMSLGEPVFEILADRGVEMIGVFDSVMPQLMTTFEVLGKGIAAVVENIISFFADFRKNVLALSEPVRAAILTIHNFFSGDWVNAWAMFLRTMSTALAAGMEQITDWAVNAFVWGYNFVVEIANGIIDAAGSVLVDSLNWVGELISSWLEPGSPPEKGPLSTIDKWGKQLMKVFGASIVKINDLDTIKNMTADMKKVFEVAGYGAGDAFIEAFEELDVATAAAAVQQAVSGIGAMVSEALNIGNMLESMKAADFGFIKQALAPVKEFFKEAFSIGGDPNEAIEGYKRVRESMVQIVAEMNETGAINEDAFSTMSGLLGEQNAELSTLLRAQLELQLAQKKLADARLGNQGEIFAIEQRIAAAREEGYVPADLLMELEQAKAKADAQGDLVSSLEAEVAEKQEAVSWQQEMMDFQKETNNLQDEFAESLKKSAKQMAKAAKAAGKTGKAAAKGIETVQEMYDKERALIEQKHELGVIDEREYVQALLSLEKKYVNRSMEEGIGAGLDAHIDKINDLKAQLEGMKPSKAGKAEVGQMAMLTMDEVFGHLLERAEEKGTLLQQVGEELGEGLIVAMKGSMETQVTKLGVDLEKTLLENIVAAIQKTFDKLREYMKLNVTSENFGVYALVAGAIAQPAIKAMMGILGWVARIFTGASALGGIIVSLAKAAIKFSVVGALVVALLTNWDEIIAELTPMFEQLKAAITGMFADVTTIFAYLKASEEFNQALAEMKRGLLLLWSSLVSALALVKKLLKIVVGGIIIGTITYVAKVAEELIILLGGVDKAAEFLANRFAKAARAFMNFAIMLQNTVLYILHGDWEGALRSITAALGHLGTVLGVVGEAFGLLGQAMFKALPPEVQQVLKDIAGYLEALVAPLGAVAEMWKPVVAEIAAAIEGGDWKTVLAAVLVGFALVFKTLGVALFEIAKKAIVDVVLAVVDLLPAPMQAKFRKIVAGVGLAIRKIGAFITDMRAEIKLFFQDEGRLGYALVELFNTIVDAVKRIWPEIAAIAVIFGKLSYTTGVWQATTTVAFGTILILINTIVAAIRTLGPIWAVVEGVLAGVVRVITGLLEIIIGLFESVHAAILGDAAMMERALDSIAAGFGNVVAGLTQILAAITVRLVGAVGAFAINFVDNILWIVQTIAGADSAIGKWIVNVREGMARIRTDWIANFEELYQYISTFFLSIDDKVAKSVRQFLEEYGTIAKIVGPIFERLVDKGKWLHEKLNIFWEWIGQGFRDGFGSLPGFWAGILDNIVKATKLYFSNAWKFIKWIIKRIIKAIFLPFAWLYDKLVGNSLIPDLIDEIIRLFGTLAIKIPTALFDAVKAVAKKGKALATAIFAALFTPTAAGGQSAVNVFIIDLFRRIIGAIRAFTGKGLMGAILNKLLGGGLLKAGGFLQKFAGIVGNVLTKLGPLGKFLGGLGKIFGRFAGPIGWVLTIFMTLRNVISNFVERLGGWDATITTFKTLWDNIVTTFEAVKTVVMDTLDQLFTGDIAGAFTTFVDGIGNIDTSGLQTTLSTIFTALWQAILIDTIYAKIDAISTAILSMLPPSFQTAVTGVQTALTGVWDWIQTDAIPFLDMLVQRFNTGLAPALDTITTKFDAFRTAIAERLQEPIANLQLAWENIQIAFAQIATAYDESLGPALAKLAEALGLNSENAGGWMEILGTLAGWFLEAALDVVIWTITGAVDALTLAIDLVALAIGPIGDLLAGIVTGAGIILDFLAELALAFQGVADAVSGGFMDTVGTVAGWLGLNAEGMVTPVEGATEGIETAFTGLQGSLIGQSIIPDTVLGIETAFTTMGTNISTGLTTLLTAFQTMCTAMLTAWQLLMTNKVLALTTFIGNLTTKYTELMVFLVEQWAATLLVLEEALEATKETLSGYLDELITKFGEVLTAVGNVETAIEAWMEIDFDDLEDALEEVVDWLEDVLTAAEAAWEAIKKVNNAPPDEENPYVEPEEEKTTYHDSWLGQKGAWRVPRTSHWTLHAGETVLPSSIASAWRGLISSLNTTGIGGRNFNVGLPMIGGVHGDMELAGEGGTTVPITFYTTINNEMDEAMFRQRVIRTVSRSVRGR